VRAVGDFLAWLGAHGVASIADAASLHVAAYVEELGRTQAAPTVKQRLAAIRRLFDWLASSGVLPFNDERRLVADVEVAAELQGAVPLGAVREDRDRRKDVADRELMRVEDGSSGHGELRPAPLAGEDAARLVAVGDDATALRACRVTVDVAPAYGLEQRVGLVLGQAGR